MKHYVKLFLVTGFSPVTRTIRHEAIAIRMFHHLKHELIPLLLCSSPGNLTRRILKTLFRIIIARSPSNKQTFCANKTVFGCHEYVASTTVFRPISVKKLRICMEELRPKWANI
ncbi:hypothetical protein X798_07918 [Onchocerca flexuosa]|uniref:Uncharacterized protein n=1 Tax=Onchocerca flexuosa TaxID=387005 RepID=A0A238BHZ7_9BILA|nr:hypothetical protein X798_07918 [Onchocerca flexuosa]